MKPWSYTYHEFRLLVATFLLDMAWKFVPKERRPAVSRAFTDLMTCDGWR